MTPRLMKLSALCVALTVGSQIWAGGPSGRGGGSDGGGHVSEISFKVLSEKTRVALNSRPDLAVKAFGVPDILNRYTWALSTTAKCAEDSKDIALLKDAHKMAYVVTVDNTLGGYIQKRMLLDCGSTYNSFVAPQEIAPEVLVFHEYSRVMGFEDDDFDFSIKLLDFYRLLESNPVDPRVRSERANLSLKYYIEAQAGVCKDYKSWSGEEFTKTCLNRVLVSEVRAFQYLIAGREDAIDAIDAYGDSANKLCKEQSPRGLIAKYCPDLTRAKLDLMRQVISPNLKTLDKYIAEFQRQSNHYCAAHKELYSLESVSDCEESAKLYLSLIDDLMH